MRVRVRVCASVVHRDVKTSNIFVTADRTLKLGDFGFAKALEAQQEALLSRVGSPFYMSPEICRNAPYSTESDVWSCGCVLYEMICLQPAFYAENMMLVLDRICAAAYDPPPEGACSDGVRELLGEMLRLQPEARPAAQQVLQHDALRPVLRQLEPPAPPPSALREPLGTDSAEAEVMRAAVQAARAREEAFAAGHDRRKDHAGGFGLFGLSRLAERGLSLLGFSFKQPQAAGDDDETARAPTPAQQSVAARAEVEATLRSMHQQLETLLGAPLLQRALTLALDALPGEEDDATAWSAWEEARLAAVTMLIGSAPHGGQPSEPAQRNHNQAPPEAPGPAPIVGAADRTVAKTVVALALWQAQAASAIADAGRAPE